MRRRRSSSVPGLPGWRIGVALLVAGCAQVTPPVAKPVAAPDAPLSSTESATPGAPTLTQPTTFDGLTVAATPTLARALDGRYISWLEHIIDDPQLGGVELSGSDGLAMADLDGDGFEDIVSVHESDTVYDGRPVGHVRVAWGSADPIRWELGTLAAGIEAAAAEDVSLADVNGDGHIDVLIACELAHLLYLQNPGLAPRSSRWPRTPLAVTRQRGSYIRAFLADLNGDGRPEAVAANKGEQNPALATRERNAISIYHPQNDPLNGAAWTEQVLGRVRIPINSQPVDIDRDGDLDVLGGSRGESRLVLFENLGGFDFRERSLRIAGSALPADSPLRRPELAGLEQPAVTGFNMDYADLDGDGRLDVVVNEWPHHLVWLRQPETLDAPWPLHVIGSMGPDQLVSVHLADIDSDGDLDAFTGGYSRGPRDRDGAAVTADDPLGRISWFENPGIDAVTATWRRHDVSRRKRGMYDMWVSRDLDGDGDLDLIGTRGNSAPYDGVFWLEQVRSSDARPALHPARAVDSMHMPLPSDTL